MKTFDVFAIVVFGIMALVTFVAGFYNTIHFLFSACCVVLVVIAYNELKSEKDKEC